MTPIPINPICIKNILSCFSLASLVGDQEILFHFNKRCSAFDDRPLLIMYTAHFTCIGGHNGMLHLHGAENHQHLALFHAITFVYLDFYDGSRHGGSEHVAIRPTGDGSGEWSVQ